MKYFAFVILTLSAIVGWTQQVKIYNEYLEPIEGVEVISILTKAHVFSNEKGNFDLKPFHHNDTLYFFHSSYLPLSIPVKYIKAHLNGRILMHYQSIYLDGAETVITVRNKKLKQERRPIKIDVLSNEKIHKIGPQTSAEVLEQASGVQIQKVNLEEEVLSLGVWKPTRYYSLLMVFE